MSLRLNMTKVKNYEELQNGDDWSSDTGVLAFATMSVGLSTITEKNIAEWLWRLAFLTKISHTVVRGTTATIHATLKRHVGMSTNATEETRAAFIKRHVKHTEQDVTYEQRTYWANQAPAKQTQKKA